MRDPLRRLASLQAQIVVSRLFAVAPVFAWLGVGVVFGAPQVESARDIFDQPGIVFPGPLLLPFEFHLLADVQAMPSIITLKGEVGEARLRMRSRSGADLRGVRFDVRVLSNAILLR
jgi:hypothetical protein